MSENRYNFNFDMADARVLDNLSKGKSIIEKLANKNICAGYDMGQLGKEFENCLLICATETKTQADIESLVKELGAI